MALLIDRTSTSRRLSGDELGRWAAARTAFISSEMDDLADERGTLAAALRQLGMSAILFEDLGGRDDDAVTAYLDGVARSDVYVGIVADRYGRMQASGRSPTHEEYLAARSQGKRISFWVARDGSNRQGNARDFVQEVQTFHTTGGFGGADDLERRVVERMGEIAADDESPWVKAGEAIFRASVIRDHGDRVEIEAQVREAAVAHYLEGLRGDQWGRASQVQLSTRDRSGVLSVERVTSETRSSSSRDMTVAGSISWTDGSGDSMAAGTTGYSAEELVEVGIRVGLLHEPMPGELGSMDFLVDGTDPLAGLPSDLTQSTYEASARLMVIERLIGARKAARIDAFAIGPPNQGRRRVDLTYTEAQRYSNVPPTQRSIDGERPA